MARSRCGVGVSVGTQRKTKEHRLVYAPLELSVQKRGVVLARVPSGEGREYCG